MRRTTLPLALRWLAVVLILRVLVAILANYPDYFPPNFDSLFLQGREATFSSGVCKVTVRRYGPYLAVRDNERCGGRNLRFRGLYVRRR